MDNTNTQPVKMDNFTMADMKSPKRIEAMFDWMVENEQNIEATDVVQVTFHIKRIRDKKGDRVKDDVQGTILQFPKKK